MTFSVVARDSVTGDLGAAVQSKFPAVGAAVLHGRGGVGAIATQALCNITYGPRGLALLEAGASAEQALDILVASDVLPERRQAGIVDASGRAASHTGAGCGPWAGHATGEGFACQGNLLVSEATIAAMAGVMRERLDLAFPERLVATLEAGQAAGGDSRGQQSAALVVLRPGGGYGGGSDRLIDLRVDDHATPIAELGRLLALHRLHFDRPRDEDLLALRGELATEVAQRLGLPAPGDIPPDEVWDRLERWAGIQNLEERMTTRGTIDPQVLSVLRSATADPAARADG